MCAQDSFQERGAFTTRMPAVISERRLGRSFGTVKLMFPPTASHKYKNHRTDQLANPSFSHSEVGPPGLETPPSARQLYRPRQAPLRSPACPGRRRRFLSGPVMESQLIPRAGPVTFRGGEACFSAFRVGNESVRVAGRRACRVGCCDVYRSAGSRAN